MKNEERRQWIADRKRGIGGSDAAAVLGISPWKTPLSVWLDKTGRAPEQPETEAMRIGTELEDYVARRYCESTGREVRRHNRMIVSGHLLGDVDRLVVPPGSAIAALKGEIRTDRILECKTTSGAGWDGEVPAYYQTQVQHYMGLCPTVLAADVAVLFVVPKRFEVIAVQRDDDVIAAMRERLEAWWARYVDADVPPPPECEDDCKMLWSASRPIKTGATEEIARAVSALREKSEAIKVLDRDVSMLKARIMASMGDADTLVGQDGRSLATWRSQKDKETVDWAAVAQEMRAPVDVIAAHTTAKTGFRVFRIC